MFPACLTSGSERTTFLGLCYEYACIKEGSSRAVQTCKLKKVTRAADALVKSFQTRARIFRHL